MSFHGETVSKVESYLVYKIVSTGRLQTLCSFYKNESFPLKSWKMLQQSFIEITNFTRREMYADQ